MIGSGCFSSFKKMKVMSFDKYLFFLAYLTKILIFWGDNNHPIIIIIKVVLIQMNDLL